MRHNTDTSPHFTFEAQNEKNFRSGHMDMLIERIGRSLRYSASYLYVCRGMHARLPETALKGSSLELDIADLVAWMTQRQLMCDLTDKQIHVPLPLLGEVQWNVIGEHQVRRGVSTGFPYQFIYEEAKQGGPNG